MTALLAAAPLVTVILGMAVLRWSAVIAGSIGLVVAGVLAITLFPIGNGDLTAGATGTLAEALFTTVTILWIILPALMLFEFQNRTGAILRIRDALGGLTANRRLQAIMIAWFFGLFIEGAAGFGTPVALAAPLLVGLGYPPVRAVVLALLGHAAGVSFGAVGTPTLVQVDLGSLDPRGLAGTIALIHALLGWILLSVMVKLADDGPLTRSDIKWSALAAVAFAVPSVVIASLVGPEVPSLGGALIGAILFVTILTRQAKVQIPGMRALLPDLAPYLAILTLVLVTRLIGPIAEWLRDVSIDWTLQGGLFSGSFQPLYHPGTLLFLGLVGSALTTGRGHALLPSLVAALVRLIAVATALAAMLTLSRLMVHSGMIGALADAAALTGTAWPLVAPAIGVLGTFITGSATASNILFTDLQLSAAGALGLPVVVMAAGQGFGSAIGNIVAPHNIIAGSATVGLTGREGEIMRQTALPAILYTALGGIVVFVLASYI